MDIYKTVGFTPDSKGVEIDLCFWGLGENGRFAIIDDLDNVVLEELEFINELDVRNLVRVETLSWARHENE